MTIDPSMTDYAGLDSFAETFRIPSDLTRGFSDRINAALKALADRTVFNRQRALADPLLVPLFGAQQSKLSAGLVERFEPWATEPDPQALSYNQRAGWLQTDITDGGGLWWFVPISSATEVTMVAASIDGSDGPGSNPGFPAAPDRPVMRIYRQPVGGGAAVRLITLADESADQTEYQQHHTLPQDPGIEFSPALQFAAGEYMLIEFVGHKGANVAPGTLKLYGIEISRKPL